MDILTKTNNRRFYSLLVWMFLTLLLMIFYIAAAVAGVIAPKEDRAGNVSGVTLRGYELFILRMPTNARIEVYDAANFTFVQYIQSAEFGGNAEGLTSCDANNCLYVSETVMQTICRVALNRSAYGVTRSWKVTDGRPRGLSVNNQQNLLVTCSLPIKIIEYRTDGLLMREIRLSETCPLWHAVELSTNKFVVSLGSRVCIVDAVSRAVGYNMSQARGQLDLNGQWSQPSFNLLATNQRLQCPTNLFMVTANDQLFGGLLTPDLNFLIAKKSLRLNCDAYRSSQRRFEEEAHISISHQNSGSAIGELNESRQIAVDKANGLIFVADINSNRIVVLDSMSLKMSRYINVSVESPFALHFDEKRNQLIIGEFTGKNSRVFVVDV